MFLTLLANAEWSILFVGAIFVGLPIAIYFLYLRTNKAIKNGRKLTATVISCKEVHNNEVEVSHYEIVYEYIGKDGQKHTYMHLSEKAAKVGAAKHMHILHEDGKHPALMDAKDAQNNFKNKGVIQLALFGFAGLILAIVLFAFFSSIYPELESFVVNKIFAPGISILFIMIGIGCLKNYFKKKATINSDNTRIIQATLIGYKRELSHDDDGSRYSYFPVYAYNQGMDTHQMTSQYSSTPKLKKGTKVNLYMDQETGKLFEKRTAKSDLILAAGFGGMGLLVLIIVIAGYVSGAM